MSIAPKSGTLRKRNRSPRRSEAGRKHLPADPKGFTVHSAEVWEGEWRGRRTALWNLSAVKRAPGDLPRVLFLSGNDYHYERRRMAWRRIHGGGFFPPQTETFTQQEAVGGDHRESDRRNS